MLTFDRLSSVFLSNTNHEEDQPAHLRVADLALQKASEHDVYAGPSARYCPAASTNGWRRAGTPRFVINAQNCVHCKTCDIKDPNQNITWVPPGGRRRAELSEYVMAAATMLPHRRFQWVAIRPWGFRKMGRILAARTQKGHSRLESCGARGRFR